MFLSFACIAYSVSAACLDDMETKGDCTGDVEQAGAYRNSSLAVTMRFLSSHSPAFSWRAAYCVALQFGGAVSAIEFSIAPACSH